MEREIFSPENSLVAASRRSRLQEDAGGEDMQAPTRTDRGRALGGLEDEHYTRGTSDDAVLQGGWITGRQKTKSRNYATHHNTRGVRGTDANRHRDAA